MELLQSGLMDHWDLWFYPIPRQCMANTRIGNKPDSKHSAISLKNLTGPFVILSIGFSLSFLAFLCELIIFRLCQLQKSKTSQVVTFTQ
jgi:ionotropic glutamate receptor